MMKFTIGAAILVFTVIVGSYQFFQDKETLNQRERGLVQVRQKLHQSKQLLERLQLVRERAMERGQDQKFTIERALGIGDPGLQLQFVGRPQSADGGDSRTFYRHTYRITGLSDFQTAWQVVRKLVEVPGFSIHKFCMNCTRTPRNTPTGYRTVQIEGYLYVYDPNSL